MIDKLDLILSSLGYLMQLAARLVAEAPNAVEAEAMLAARLRRLLDKNDLLAAVQAEDQRILDSRIAKPV